MDEDEDEDLIINLFYFIPPSFVAKLEFFISKLAYYITFVTGTGRKNRLLPRPKGIAYKRIFVIYLSDHLLTA